MAVNDSYPVIEGTTYTKTVLRDALRDAMADAGFDDDLIERICWRNWLDALERIWGA